MVNGYVFMNKDIGDTFRTKIDNYYRCPIFIYEDKIIIEDKVKSTYRFLTKSDSFKTNRDSIINYTAIDNNLQKCRVSYYTNDDPAYFYIDYGDSIKYYFLLFE